ncbi:hypothetical protein A3K63_03515 [Candidatus Micrarchaeota archaeon RBG_16_49_10]|nr:MAG: hypothetical protein A3K63_03515 [Candidatus Micrarchaeota archaeon RBG_16_49_10]
MEFTFIKNEITMNNKELNILDKFVIDFIEILKEHSDYVIVSGYVSIFFGRSRATEDVDILVPKMDRDEFSRLFNDLIKEYWFINSGEESELYKILDEKMAIRVAKKEQMMPNIEMKFISNSVDRGTFDNRMKVLFDSNELFFSPIEIQIIYKAFLGSEKDILDAILLARVFKNYLNPTILIKFSKDMDIKEKVLKRIFGGTYEEIFDKRAK